jgi:D-amino-acid dehydrogenase
MKIAIIGAGITGLLPAYYLAKNGHQVEVFEQESYPAMRTSFANGGQVSVSNSEVWTTWANVIKGIKWMVKKDAPLLIRPSLDWDKAAWLARFLIVTAGNDSVRNTAQTIRLGIESRKLYQEIIDREKISFDQNHCGILHVYRDKKYFQQAAMSQELYRANGCEWEMLDSSQVKRLEPALADHDSIIGGAWTPSDWVGDIHLFCVELHKILIMKYGVKFYFDRKIENFQKFDHDKIVIAGGMGSVKLSKLIKDPLPIYPIKGYSVTIELDNYSASFSPKTSLLDDQAKIVVSRLGNRLRVAGTAELAGENYDISRERIDPLINWVRDNLPKINRRVYSQWACLRPMTPNMLPIVRVSKNPRFLYHTGHGHLGWTISPATSVKLVELINQ